RRRRAPARAATGRPPTPAPAQLPRAPVPGATAGAGASPAGLRHRSTRLRPRREPRAAMRYVIGSGCPRERVLPRLLDERRNPLAGRVGLRVPLHAEDEALVGHLDRLRQLVEVGPAGHHEILAEPPDALVM